MRDTFFMTIIFLVAISVPLGMIYGPYDQGAKHMCATACKDLLTKEFFEVDSEGSCWCKGHTRAVRLINGNVK